MTQGTYDRAAPAQLAYRQAGHSAAQDGVLLWDAAQDGPTATRDGDFARLALRVPVPATATSPGQPGDYAADDSWLYVCTAASVWRRVAVAAW